MTILHKRKEEDIISDLIKGKYYKKDGNFKYLLKLYINSFTKEKLEKLKNEIDNLDIEINSLEKISIKQLWLNDLNLFQINYT